MSVGKNFSVIGKIGEGSFSDVFKVRSTVDHSIYAAKRLKKIFPSINGIMQIPEILYLRQLQGHPNIIRMYDVTYDPSNGCVAILLELMDISMYEYMKQHRQPMNEFNSLLLTYQLLHAVSYMHEKNLFHRDIKPENCMIDSETFDLKLVDFGSTRETQSKEPYTEYVSTRWYRAPECILTSGSYDKSVDEWAVGCILYELLTARPLFPGKHEIDQINKIHNIVGTPDRELLSFFRNNPNPQITFTFPRREAQDFKTLIPTISTDTADLLKKLLMYDPNNRLSAKEALLHPAFELIHYLHDQWISSGASERFSIYVRNSMSQEKEISKCGVPKPIKQIKQPIVVAPLANKPNHNTVSAPNKGKINKNVRVLNLGTWARKKHQQQQKQQQQQKSLPRYQFHNLAKKAPFFLPSRPPKLLV